MIAWNFKDLNIPHQFGISKTLVFKYCLTHLNLKLSKTFDFLIITLRYYNTNFTKVL